MKRRRQVLQVSTFPFLAVLLCAMGSLILLLLVMDKRAKAVARMKALQAAVQEDESEARAAAARKAEWERRRRTLYALLEQEDQQIVSQTNAARTRARSTEAETQAREAEHRALEKALEEARARLKQGELELASRRAGLDKQGLKKDASSKELVRLTQELNLLEQTVQDLKLLHKRDQRTYSLIPYRGKRGDTRKPIYIECAAGRVVFHPDAVVLEGPRVRGADVLAEVQRQIKRQLQAAVAVSAKNADRPYLLMLVRPNGITTYFKVLSLLQGMQFDYGYEFVDQDWVLDFSEQGEGKRPDWMMASSPVVSPGPSPNPKVPAVRPRGIPRQALTGVVGIRQAGVPGGPGNGSQLIGADPPLAATGVLPGPAGSAAASGSPLGTRVGVTAGATASNSSRPSQGIRFGSGRTAGETSVPQGPLAVLTGRPTDSAAGNPARPNASFPTGDPWRAGSGTGSPIGLGQGGSVVGGTGSGNGNGPGAFVLTPGTQESTELTGRGGAPGDGPGLLMANGGLGNGQGYGAAGTSADPNNGSATAPGASVLTGGPSGSSGQAGTPGAQPSAGSSTGKGNGLAKGAGASVLTGDSSGSSGSSGQAGSPGAQPPAGSSAGKSNGLAMGPGASVLTGAPSGSSGQADTSGRGSPQQVGSSTGSSAPAADGGAGRATASGSPRISSGGESANGSQTGTANGDGSSGEDGFFRNPVEGLPMEGAPRPAQGGGGSQSFAAGGGQGGSDGPQFGSAGSTFTGSSSSSSRAPGPRKPPLVMPTTVSRLIGDRDWIIPIECRSDAVVVRSAHLQLSATALEQASSRDNPLAQAVAQLISRRQATVRAGDPPYRPVIQLQVQPNGLRTYYLTYPLLQSLGVRMSRKDLEPVEKKREGLGTRD
jgi:hypothetical protein